MQQFPVKIWNSIKINILNYPAENYTFACLCMTNNNHFVEVTEDKRKQGEIYYSVVQNLIFILHV